MTSADIEFLNDPAAHPAPITYDPVKLGEWQDHSLGKLMPSGLKLALSRPVRFNCPNSTFNIDIYSVDHMGNGWADFNTAESAVDYLKGCLGSEELQARDRLLSKVPKKLVEQLKALKDEEQIEGPSDWGCKWTISKDIRTIHSDDLHKIIDLPTLRLCETESGEDHVIVTAYSIFYVSIPGGIPHQWFYASPEVLVSTLSYIMRIHDEDLVIRDLKILKCCDSLSLYGSTYSDNKETIVTLSKTQWRIDKKGKELLHG